MSRKLTKVDFARIWGEVSRLSEKDWTDLVELRNRLDATRPGKYSRRKAKGQDGPQDVTSADTDAVVRKMGLRGPSGEKAEEKAKEKGE